MERSGSGGELDGQFVHLLLLLALHVAVVGAAFFIVKTIQRFAVARGHEHLVPDGIDFKPGLFEGGGAFLEAKLKHVAPGARAKKFNRRDARRKFAGEIVPARQQFLAGRLDATGGFLANAERVGVFFLRRLFLLFAQHGQRGKGEVEGFHKCLFFGGSRFRGRGGWVRDRLLQQRPALVLGESFAHGLA
jgi:hypothetical protein